MKKNQGLIPDQDEPVIRQIIALHEFRFGAAATRKFLVDAAAFKVGPLAELTVSAFLRELASGVPASVVTEPGSPPPATPIPAPAPVPTPSEPIPPKGGTPTSVPSQPVVDRKLMWGPGTRVYFHVPEILTWPTKIVKKRVCATLCANGEKIEWIAAGRQYGDFHNATVAVDKKTGKPGKYFKNFQRGQVIRVSLKDITGKKEIQLGTLGWRVA